MFGKIVQLRGVKLEDRFEVEYGIDFTMFRVVDLGFVRLTIIGVRPETDQNHFTYIWGRYTIEDYGDGYKGILLLGVDEEENDIYKNGTEDSLFVIIPYAEVIETTADKISGRYPTEAILEMHAGDIVKVSKGTNAITETYMAVQAGNEMFLIKKNR